MDSTLKITSAQFSPPQTHTEVGVWKKSTSPNSYTEKKKPDNSHDLPVLQQTNLTVVGLSLNRSQCGGCSNKLRHPDRDLGRLRMIWRLRVTWGGYFYDPDTGRLRRRPAQGPPSPWLCRRGRRGRSARAYRCLPRRGRSSRRRMSGRDSGLEAFSHNPPDGSFAPSARQPST